VRAVFAVYLVFIVGALAFFWAVGLAHR